MPDQQRYLACETNNLILLPNSKTTAGVIIQFDSKLLNSFVDNLFKHALISAQGVLLWPITALI